MEIWIVIAVLTAATLLGVLWPLLKGAPRSAPRRDYDRAIFSDQLAELDRDLARGTIAPPEAEAARNEISRRLIATAAGTEVPEAMPLSRKAWILTVIIAVPLLAVPLYLRSGAPGLPDVPQRDRIAHATENKDFEGMVAEVERHLKQEPADVEGWAVLAPAYKRMDRFADAAEAYRKIVVLGRANANTFADMGEMLVFAGEGMVNAEADKAFAESLKLDAKQPKARFYAAMGLRQEGKAKEAIAAWKALLDDSPPDAPWRAAVEKEMTEASAADMAPEDRQAMIRGMVDGLQERLKANGDDLEGWKKLINARKVLGEIDEARTAYQSARAAFKDKPEALAELDGLARSLNLQ